MVEESLINQIKEDFSIVLKHKKIAGVLLYGSYASDDANNKSDIDVCIVAPNEDVHELISFVLQNVNVRLKNYDVRIFKELPLYIKIQIIEKGIVVYSPDIYDLYEYFYFYRKLWEDQKHRQQITTEELLSF